MAFFGGYRVHHPFLNPRTLTGGKSGYVFRRETSLVPADATPSLSISSKLMEKEGIIFGGARDFWNLTQDSRGTMNSVGMDRITTEELNSFLDDEKEKSDKAKKRKAKKPSTKMIRNHLRDIVRFHEDKVKKSMHCAYPLMDEILEMEEQSSKDCDSLSNHNKAFSYPSKKNIPPPGFGSYKRPSKRRKANK
jgi:hypothetical protein